MCVLVRRHVLSEFYINSMYEYGEAEVTQRLVNKHRSMIRVKKREKNDKKKKLKYKNPG